MPIGDFPESLSQAMLVGIMLVGKLGVGPAGRVVRVCRLPQGVLIASLRDRDRIKTGIHCKLMCHDNRLSQCMRIV